VKRGRKESNFMLLWWRRGHQSNI